MREVIESFIYRLRTSNQVLEIIEFLLFLLIRGFVVQCLDCVPNRTDVALELAHQCHNLPRVAQYLNALSVRIISQAKWSLYGGAEVAHL